MAKVKFLVTCVGVALVAAGCASSNRQAELDTRFAPVSTTRHGAGHAAAHYALGRYYQGQMRYDQAIQAYSQVLEAQPDHAEAHNALGVIYATLGRQEAAEREIRRALELAPAAPHIHNNLGYALLLQGRAAEAVEAFQASLRLDPRQPRAADNLKTALARLESNPTAASPVKTAEAVAAAGSPVSTIEPPPAPRQVAAVAANVYELPLPVSHANDRPAVPALKTEQPAGTAPLPARVEVANGNGVEGLARLTSTYLRGKGYEPARLTNQKPFTQDQTEIQYRPGFEQQARSLQAVLAGKGVVARSDQMRRDIQVRVVLGKDLRTRAQLAEIEAGPLRLADNQE